MMDSHRSYTMCVCVCVGYECAWEGGLTLLCAVSGWQTELHSPDGLTGKLTDRLIDR